MGCAVVEFESRREESKEEPKEATEPELASVSVGDKEAAKEDLCPMPSAKETIVKSCTTFEICKTSKKDDGSEILEIATVMPEKANETLNGREESNEQILDALSKVTAVPSFGGLFAKPKEKVGKEQSKTFLSKKRSAPEGENDGREINYAEFKELSKRESAAFPLQPWVDNMKIFDFRKDGDLEVPKGFLKFVKDTQLY